MFMAEELFTTDLAKLRKRGFWFGLFYISLTLFLLFFGRRAYGDFGTVILVLFVAVGIYGTVISFIYYKKLKQGDVKSAKRLIALSLGILYLVIGIGGGIAIAVVSFPTEGVTLPIEGITTLQYLVPIGYTISFLYIAFIYLRRFRELKAEVVQPPIQESTNK